MSNDERRRSKVVCLHVRRNAAFEVTVAGQNGSRDQALFVDRLGDRCRQWTGVTDASRAAEADEVEAKRIQILLESSGFKISGNHLRAGSKRGLDPRLGLEALGNCVAGQKTSSNQHAWVGGVGAGGDCGNCHIAMTEIEIFTFNSVTRSLAGGLLVFGFK